MPKLYKLLLFVAALLTLPVLVLGDFVELDNVIIENQIDVISLAKKIRARESILLIDLRDDDSRAQMSLPTAISLSDALPKLNKYEKEETTIVVYGYEDNRLWVNLHEDGYPLHFLANGVHQWMSSILSPVVYRKAPEKELQAFAANSEISRYFGGLPRFSDVPVVALSTEQQLADLRRQGCGF